MTECYKKNCDEHGCDDCAHDEGESEECRGCETTCRWEPRAAASEVGE